MLSPPLSAAQGVGSHAAHLLLRSGVGRLRLVDFDQVTLSTLNRHCLATRADVGTPKATCLAAHFKGAAGRGWAGRGLGGGWLGAGGLGRAWPGSSAWLPSLFKVSQMI